MVQYPSGTVKLKLVLSLKQSCRTLRLNLRSFAICFLLYRSNHTLVIHQHTRAMISYLQKRVIACYQSWSADHQPPRRPELQIAERIPPFYYLRLLPQYTFISQNWHRAGLYGGSQAQAVWVGEQLRLLQRPH